MENINRLLIQLDKAVNCIKSKYPQERSIAIILLDNLIEVQLYRTLTRKIFINKNPKLGERIMYRYEDRDISNYKDILKISSENSIISKDDLELLDLAHSIRNKIYHKGDFYDEAKIDLAMILYYIFLSENFKKMYCSYGFTSYQNSPAYEEIHFGQSLERDNFKLSNAKEYFRASSDVIFSRWVPRNTLSATITTILVGQIESVKSGLEFINTYVKEDNDYYNRNNIKEIDSILLYYLFIRKNRDKLNCIQDIIKKNEARKALFQDFQISNNYKYPYWIDFEKIEDRVKAFKNKSENYIVKNFRDIESKMYNIYQDVNEASSDLDGYIQHCIDIARGK